MFIRSFRLSIIKRIAVVLIICGALYASFFYISRYSDPEEVYYGKGHFDKRPDSAVKFIFNSLNLNESCPEIDSNTDLIGRLPTDLLQNETITEDDILKLNNDLKADGYWSPEDCQAVHKVAIIIPYRDRKSHLTRFLAYLIPILKRQRLNFRLIVTEQLGDDLFNKGRIMNAAFAYAESLEVDCVIFHDVDMFPEDDRIPYCCPTQPRHLGAFVDTLKYKLKYKEIAGGALVMTMEDYRTVNGYSNLYWGWGGEDDDIGYRIYSLNLTLERPDPQIARFTMLKHKGRGRAAEKLMYTLLWKATTRIKTDGLNQKLWTVKNATIFPLYHHLLVDVGSVPPEWRRQMKP